MTVSPTARLEVELPPAAALGSSGGGLGGAVDETLGRLYYQLAAPQSGVKVRGRWRSLSPSARLSFCCTPFSL